MSSHYDEFFFFGDTLIAETREVILGLWNRGNIASSIKDDDTPVSEVDLQCEELVRDRIRSRFPAHGVIGEEHGEDSPNSEFVWTIDPIDGTQNLVNRIPTFGTILSLLHNGTPVLGWIDHPVLGDLLRGGPGIGVTKNGVPVTVKDLQTPHLTANDIVGTNCPATFARGGHEGVLATILAYHPHIRMYYDVYSHSLTITGSLAAMVEYNLKIWDLAATKALIEGAGGTYLEIGADDSPGKPRAYHAVFGKGRAVNLLVGAISGVPEGCI